MVYDVNGASKAARIRDPVRPFGHATQGILGLAMAVDTHLEMNLLLAAQATMQNRFLAGKNSGSIL